MVFYNRMYRIERKLRSLSILGVYVLRIFLYITGFCIIFIAGRSVGLSACKRISVWHFQWETEVTEDFDNCQHDVDFGRYLVTQLKVIAEELGENASPDVVRALQNVMKSLDPQEAIVLEKKLAIPISPENAQSCGEIYDRPHGPFYEVGFIPDPKCDPNSMPSLETLVTVILLAPESVSSYNHVDHPLAPLRKLYPKLAAVIVTDRRWYNIAKRSQTKVLEVRTREFKHPGSLWNQMVQKVNTPYVLVARGIERVDELARLQRLIFVLSTSKIIVAGGAIRHASGRWRAACLQTQLRNYTLRMQRGYRYSALDCMLCDHLEGPFLTSTDFLRHFPLHDKLPPSVIFEDWFLRVKRRRAGVVSCPDSLFFMGETESEPYSTDEFFGIRRNGWREFAKHWQLDHIFPPGRLPIRFTCNEVGLSCNLPELHNNGLLMPSCCAVKIIEVLKAFDEFATRFGLDYELSEGTLLGAVKLRSIMPWDTDADIFIQLKDFFTYLGNQHEMSKVGHKFSAFTQTTVGSHIEKYFTIFSQDIEVDVYGLENLTKVALPEEIQNIPTKVEINGLWFRGGWNPGLIARNRYGPGYLQHAQSWRRQGMATHMDRYGVGTWGNCSKTFHHACLNRYPTDGSFDLLNDNR